MTLPPHPDAGKTRERVLELLRRHGWNASSFQVLESHFHYWFWGEGACVAYVDTGGAWVAAGAPLCAPEQLREVAARFIQAAAQGGRRACFFGTESRFVEASSLCSFQLGEQPSWTPSHWHKVLQSSSSLREQLRRARAKGLRVRELHPSEAATSESPTRDALDKLVTRWSGSRAMPPLRFLVELEPFSHVSEKRTYVAEVDRVPVGFLSAVPVFRRDGWLFEDFIRDPDAPNGTVESLVDHAMRTAAQDGSAYVTLGMVPLSGPLGTLLRVARFVGQGFYDFEGLRRFKAKLHPDGWTPIFLSHPRSVGRLRALVDVLTAFAGTSLWRFAARALFTGPAFFVGLLAAALVPWTVVLACAPVSKWFPNRGVWAAWVVFDAVLALSLGQLARRWRAWLGALLAGAITLDAALTWTEAVRFNVPRIKSAADGIVVAVAVLAPTLAAAFLWRVVWEKGRRAEHAELPPILKFPGPR